MALNHDPYSTNKVTVTAPYATTRGAGVLKGNLFGVALSTELISTPVSLATKGTYTLAKKTTDTPAIGAVVYWDDTNKYVTTTSTSNYAIGVVVNAAGTNGGTTVDVKLNGTHVVAS